jgi:hypothetical protein
VPPRSQPSVSKLIMPRLLRPCAGISSFGPTLCRLTARGTAMPCSFPSVLIHMHRVLWMWPAIIRTVRRGAPGTVAPHTSGGKCSTRKTVTRLLVLHAASSISRWSSAECMTTLQKIIKLAPRVRQGHLLDDQTQATAPAVLSRQYFLSPRALVAVGRR